MKHGIRFALISAALFIASKEAHAQVSIRIFSGSNCYNPCGSSVYYNPFGRSAFYSNPYGTSIYYSNPYNGPFLPSNPYVPTVGVPATVCRTFTRPVVPTVVTPIPGCNPYPPCNTYSGISVTYGSPLVLGGNYSNYSNMVEMLNATRGYGSYYNQPMQQPSPGASVSDYLPGLTYDRVNPPANRSPVTNGAQELEQTRPLARVLLPPAPAAPEEPPIIVRDGVRIERGDVQIEFMNNAKTIEVTWTGNPSDVRAVTFMARDSLRVPTVLRRVSTAPYRVRFELSPSSRFVGVDVEYKDGATSATQIPLK